MSIARALAVLGSGVQGLGQGEEAARKRQRQEEDDAFRKEQRDRQRTQWQRDDAAYTEAQADKEAERQAMAPTEVKPDLAPDQMGPAGFNAGGKTFSNPDQAKSAATAYNAPAAGMRRAAGAVRNPTRAADLQARADQAELGAISLDATKQAQEAQVWDRKLYDAARAADPKALTDFMTASKADGLDGSSKWAHKVNGDKLSIYPVGPDGTALSQGFTIPNTPAGRLELVTQLSKATPITAKLADLRAQQKLAADAEDKKADNARADRKQTADEKYQQGMLGVHQAELGIKRDALSARGAGGSGGGGGAAADGPVWDDKASTFLRQKFTVTDPTSGETRVDGSGLQFGKAMALAFARRNGGDLDSAIGGAFDIDARLRAAATDPKGAYDPAKHNALRQQAMQSLTAPRVQQPAQQATDTPPPSTPRPSVPQPRAGMAAAAPVAAGPESVIGKAPVTPNFQPVPELEQALAKEMMEMAEGKRMKFSTPEIAAYGKARKAAADSAQQAPAGMTELQRAQQLSRQQLGKV